MNRRSFLTLLGLAPVAAPAALAAATAPQAKALRWSTAHGAPYMRGFSRRILFADEVDTYAAIAAEGSTAELIEQRIITWPKGPEKDRLRRVLQDFVAARGRVPTLLEWRDMRAAPVPLAFIDDVGSGP